jgi:hypothetical protein
MAGRRRVRLGEDLRDAQYVALASILGCRLVTLDGRLRRGAARLGFVEEEQRNELAALSEFVHGRRVPGVWTDASFSGVAAVSSVELLRQPLCRGCQRWAGWSVRCVSSR